MTDKERAAKSRKKKTVDAPIEQISNTMFVLIMDDTAKAKATRQLVVDNEDDALPELLSMYKDVERDPEQEDQARGMHYLDHSTDVPYSYYEVSQKRLVNGCCISELWNLTDPDCAKTILDSGGLPSMHDKDVKSYANLKDLKPIFEDGREEPQIISDWLQLVFPYVFREIQWVCQSNGKDPSSVTFINLRVTQINEIFKLKNDYPRRVLQHLLNNVGVAMMTNPENVENFFSPTDSLFAMLSQARTNRSRTKTFPPLEVLKWYSNEKLRDELLSDTNGTGCGFLLEHYVFQIPRRDKEDGSPVIGTTEEIAEWDAINWESFLVKMEEQLAQMHAKDPRPPANRNGMLDLRSLKCNGIVLKPYGCHEGIRVLYVKRKLDKDGEPTDKVVVTPLNDIPIRMIQSSRYKTSQNKKKKRFSMSIQHFYKSDSWIKAEPYTDKARGKHVHAYCKFEQNKFKDWVI